MIKRNITLAFLLLASATLMGCFKERIDLELNNDNNKRLVINAWITDSEESQSINLTYTSDYLDQVSKDYVNNASIFLKSGNTETTLIHTKDGDYHLPEDWRGEVGETYEIIVDLDDKTYTASSTMRFMPEVENIYAEISEDYDAEEDEEPFYDIFFSFTENQGEGDGYYGVIYNKNSLAGDTIWNGDFVNDDFIDGAYFEDVNLTNSTHNLGDTVILEMHSIGIETAGYLSDIQTEVFRGGLFDAAPVNVRSNFTNGALGYFITSGQRKIEYIIE